MIWLKSSSRSSVDIIGMTKSRRKIFTCFRGARGTTEARINLSRVSAFVVKRDFDLLVAQPAPVVFDAINLWSRFSPTSFPMKASTRPFPLLPRQLSSGFLFPSPRKYLITATRDWKSLFQLDFAVFALGPPRHYLHITRLKPKNLLCLHHEVVIWGLSLRLPHNSPTN